MLIFKTVWNNLKVLSKLLLFLLLLIVVNPISGQNYYFHQLSKNEGLSNQTNVHLASDPNQYFWISSRDGMNRYDGEKVKIYRPEGNQDPNITSKIFNSSDGKVWFSSNNALNWVKPDSDRLFSWKLTEDSLGYYYLIYLEKDQFLWLSAYDYLFRINIQEHLFQVDRMHSYDAFQAYPILDEKKFVIGWARPLIELGGGVEIIKYRHDKKTPQIDTFFVNTSKNTAPLQAYFYHLWIENPTSIWLPSSKGLIHFNPENSNDYQVYQHSSEEGQFYYTNVLFDPDNEILWLTSKEAGLLLFNKREKKFIKQELQLNIEGTLKTLQDLNSLYLDEQKNLWLSVFDKGLFYTNLSNTKFEQLLPQQELINFEGKFVKHIVEDSHGNYYFLILGAGLFKLYKKNKTYKLIKVDLPAFPSSLISGIYAADNDQFWIVGNGQLQKWSSEANILQPILEISFFTNDIVNISPDSTMILEGNGLYFYNPNLQANQSQELNSFFSSSGSNARLFYDHKSEIGFLVDRNNMLTCFLPKKQCKVLKKYFDVGFINSIYPSESDTTIWLASSNGLFSFSTIDFQIKKIEDKWAYLERSFVSVIEDDSSRVWLGSYNGVYLYDTRTKESYHFNAADGLFNDELSENTILKTSEGKILIGGNKGITTVNPHSFQLYTNPPAINLEKIKTGDQPLTKKAFLARSSIPYKDNNVVFQFSMIEYADPKNNRFEAFLIKNNTDTIFTGADTNIDLPQLQEANYQLHAYAYNSDGIGTTSPYVLNFTIRPPWYRTWWARTLGILLLASLFYFWYRYRIRQIEKRETFKRKEAEFKQKEAEYKQLVAETETAVLRLQMNPHFIFNSMNSINRYIIEKDIDSASSYLDEFARLMRLTLELSTEALISVEEELEFLDLYLKAEIRRLGHDLNYQVEWPDEIEIDEVLIPTMILQPFIENAIWHGISPKRSAGNIWLKFQKKNNQLLCDIIDDGVGRSYHQKTIASGHHSRAIQITHRRLELLEQKWQQKTKVKIEDIYDQEKKPSGTKVSLLLPFIK